MSDKQEKKHNNSQISLLEKLFIFFRSPVDVLRRRFPDLPTFTQIADKLNGFKLRLTICEGLYNHFEKKNNNKLAKFFKKRIDKLNDVNTHVLVKYIAKELFLYFFICFLFFFVVFFVNQILLVAETLLKKRAPVGSVLRLLWYSLPAIVAQSAPFATLVGFLMCLGRMVTDNEVLILRASGQRYSIILKPVLIMGFIISVFSFIVNDYFLPLGTLNYNKLYRQIIVSNPAVEMESNSIKRMNDATIVIGNVTKNAVSDMVFFDSDKSGNQRIIVAQDTQVSKTVSPGVLMQLKMNDAFVLFLKAKNKKDYELLSADSMVLNIFESSIITNMGGTSPREMTSYDLMKKIKSMANQKNTTPKQMNTYKLEYNKKFSIPFGSIFFAILAFPLALVFGRKDGQTLGLIFGIIISVLYWAATILGQIFGIRGGYNGFWMMWGPNFFIGIVGIILYLRLKRK